jgi:hypothetical protein
MSTGINVTKQIKILDEGIQLTADVSQIDFTGGVTATTVGNNVTVNVPAAGITVGTTPVTSGTDGRVFFQAGGVLQQDAAFFWDNTNKRLGVGATPSTSVRLDVRAQGALSTDIAFRVRNSANTGNLIESRGNGTHIIGDGTYNIIINNTTGNHLVNGNISIVNTFDLRSNITHTNGVQDISFRTTQAPLTNGYALNPYYERFIFGATSTSGWGTGNPSRFIGIINGTAPNGTVANGFALYSAAVTAGNAAPHFRTENGNIIKLYRETTAVAAATFVANTSLIANDTATFDGYTIGQVVKALRNLGILA